MSTAYETTQTAARVYAEALLQLASEQKLTDDIEAELNELMRLWREQPDFAALMNSVAIDDDARRTSLRNIFAGRVHELLLNLMLVLNDKGRTMSFAEIADAFGKLLDAQRGRQRAYVTTAVAMTDEQRRKVADQARRLSGREPVLVERIDPDILGGVVLQIGDHVVDGSLKLKLRKMKADLYRTMDKQLLDSWQRFSVG